MGSTCTGPEASRAGGEQPVHTAAMLNAHMASLVKLVMLDRQSDSRNRFYRNFARSLKHTEADTDYEDT